MTAEDLESQHWLHSKDCLCWRSVVLDTVPASPEVGDSISACSTGVEVCGFSPGIRLTFSKCC